MPNQTADQNNTNDPWAWSLWRNHMTWKNDLDRKAAHKALGLPEDMNISADNRRSGLGWKEMAVLAAAGLGGWHMYNQSQQPPIPQQAIQQGPVDTEYEVRFYDADGNLIDVPNIAKRPVE